MVIMGCLFVRGTRSDLASASNSIPYSASDAVVLLRTRVPVHSARGKWLQLIRVVLLGGRGSGGVTYKAIAHQSQTQFSDQLRRKIWKEIQDWKCYRCSNNYDLLNKFPEVKRERGAWNRLFNCLNTYSIPMPVLRHGNPLCKTYPSYLPFPGSIEAQLVSPIRHVAK